MPRMTKEGHDQIKADLRARGMRSRPGRPYETIFGHRVLWYWWDPAESSRGRTLDSESRNDGSNPSLAALEVK